ncbi:MAG TPA: hypothetical protein VNJ06_15105 [Gemmatimonadales bacterium]|nr:hypothetical protein [Gemmatimonadales bacterium]
MPGGNRDGKSGIAARFEPGLAVRVNGSLEDGHSLSKTISDLDDVLASSCEQIGLNSPCLVERNLMPIDSCGEVAPVAEHRKLGGSGLQPDPSAAEP